MAESKHFINVLNPEKHCGDGINNSYISYEITSKFEFVTITIITITIITIITITIITITISHCRRKGNTRLEEDIKIFCG